MLHFIFLVLGGMNKVIAPATLSIPLNPEGHCPVQWSLNRISCTLPYLLNAAYSEKIHDPFIL